MTQNQWEHFIFLHIPKTAGTTLNHIIARQYPAPTVFSLGPVVQESLAEFKALPEERRAQIRLLTGHMGYGMHSYFPGSTSYFTLLRDPVDRVISFYYFVRRNRTHYLHDFVIDKNLSLREFMDSRVSIMISNFQTRLISGVWNAYEFGQCPPDALETAKANLRHNFTVVGLTEAFDQTLLLFQQAYGWRNICYTRHNVTKSRPVKDLLDRDTLAAIEAANKLDLALYAYASLLFAEQWREAGAAMERRLIYFRLLNHICYPLQQIYWKSRKWSVGAWFYQQFVMRKKTG
ncbi:MAG: sulfotransferase family 2 domain-containing protein [Anaerolineae bacterium]